MSMGEMCKYFFKRWLDRFFVPKGLRILAGHQLALPKSPDQIVASIRSYPHISQYHLLGAMQNESELIQLLSAVRDIQPNISVEIGTASGGTLFCWSHYTQDLLVSVDLPRGAFGGGYEKTRIPFYEAFKGNHPGLQIELVRGQSAQAETVRRVQTLLCSKPIDFLFVDGDHTEKGLWQDLRAYLPLVADGGLVALHDIEAHKNQPDCQVNRVWNEIKLSWQGQTILSTSEPCNIGIGWFVWRRSYLDSSIWERRI